MTKPITTRLRADVAERLAQARLGYRVAKEAFDAVLHMRPGFVEDFERAAIRAAAVVQELEWVLARLDVLAPADVEQAETVTYNSSKPVCKGDYSLGTACGRCERCASARERSMRSKP